MRGFLLTLDALLAMSLISLTAWFFLAHTGYTPPLADWTLLAHDQARTGFDAAAFGRLSGLKTSNQPLLDSPSFAHGVFYKYPVVCQGALVGNEPCLTQNDAFLAPFRSEAWVGP